MKTDAQRYIEKYEAAEAAGRKLREQLKHALIRIHLLNHQKVKPLKRLFGTGAKLALIQVYLDMSAATDAVVSKDTILQAADDCDVSAAGHFFEYCLKEGLIHEELGGYSNSVVIEDQEAYAKSKYIGFVESERKRRGRGGGSSADAAGDRPVPVPVPIPSAVQGRSGGSHVYVYDLKILIKELDTPKIRAALDMFVAKLRAQGRPLDQLTLDPMIAPYQGRPADLERDLLYSASRTRCLNLITAPETQKHQDKKQSEVGIRRTIHNHVDHPKPPPRSEEQRTRDHKLMKDKLGIDPAKIKTIK